MLAIFDLDGTLSDPYDGITRSIEHALTSLGRALPNPDELRAFIGPPLHENFARWLPAELVEPAIALYRERYDEVGWRENQMYEAVPQMLEDLRSGGWRLAVATSKLTVFAERITDHFGLAERFELVVGTSIDDVLPSKAEVIARVLIETGVQCAGAVMIGDRWHDVAGALACGVRPLGVGWGYAEAGELEAAGAEYVAATPADLVVFLSGSAKPEK